MIGVISADIIGSQNHRDPETWLQPMKDSLKEFGEEGRDWEMYWGDGFQIRFADASDIIERFLLLKSGLRAHEGLDARIGLGIAEEDYESEQVKFSQGAAYVNAAYALKDVRKLPCLTAFRSPNKDLDREINLLLELASIAADSWKSATSQVVHALLQNRDHTQNELAELLSIRQPTVSAHLSRSNVQSLLKMESWCRNRILELCK